MKRVYHVRRETLSKARPFTSRCNQLGTARASQVGAELHLREKGIPSPKGLMGASRYAPDVAINEIKLKGR